MYCPFTRLIFVHFLSTQANHLNVFLLQEVSDEDEGIYCESGCERWFHRTCVGLTKVAFQLLNNEDYAEWACDQCIETKMVPSVKMAAT